MSALLAHDVVGSGPAVLAVHGAYSTRAEIRGFLQPMLPDHRILCPDLPGMGESPAAGVTSAADAVDRLDRLVEARFGDQPFVAVGHSFGAHLVRGVVARRRGQVRGMVLLCPLVPGDQHPEPAIVVADDGAAATLPADLGGQFQGYFVVRTETTVSRFRTAVVPSLGRVDAEAVQAQMESAELDTEAPEVPVLVLVARHDAWAGWRQHLGLLDAYPRASAVVVADAGHALPHERPDVVADALTGWLGTLR